MSSRRLACWTAVAVVFGACGSDAGSTTSPVGESSNTEAAPVTPVSSSAPAPDTERAASVPAEPTDEARLEDAVTRQGWSPNGVAMSWKEADSNDGVSSFSVAGSLSLDRCRWRGPGRYVFDLEWAGGEGHDYPVEVAIELYIWPSDTGDGGVGVVELSGPGKFSLDLSSTGDYEEKTGREWSGFGRKIRSQQRASCEASTIDARTGSRSDVVVDPFPSPASPAAAGSVEALSESADFTGAIDTSWTIASLLRHTDLPVLDRLYIAVEQPLWSIRVTRIGECIDIASTYELSDDRSVEVTQSAGCPKPDVVPGVTPGWEHLTEVVIDDTGWRVAAVGGVADAELVAGQLIGLPFEAADSEPPSGFDADAFLDGQVAAYTGEDSVEVARFDWRGGRVALVRTGGPDWPFADEAIVAHPDGFNAGSSGLFCRDFSIYESDLDDRAFIIVSVIGDRTVHIDVDGTGPLDPEPIELAQSETLPDVRAALIDLAEPLPWHQVSSTEDLIMIFNPDGSPTPCVQG